VLNWRLHKQDTAIDKKDSNGKRQTAIEKQESAKTKQRMAPKTINGDENNRWQNPARGTNDQYTFDRR
jgi:hypothetical protein